MESYRRTRKIRCKSTDSSIPIDLNLKLGEETQSSTSDQELGETHDNQEDSYISDSESSSSDRSPKRFKFFTDNGLIQLNEEDDVYKVVDKAFHSAAIQGVGVGIGMDTNVVAIHKNTFLGVSAQARLRVFQVFCEAVKKKCRTNNGNIKYAWYSASKDEVDSIINHGFGKSENNCSHGFGVYLSPHSLSLESLTSATKDEDGLCHVMLCRVILGNVEEVPLGSKQSHPSSKIYDSGVDNAVSPKKFIVWSSNMNTHILPEYVITYKAPDTGVQEPGVAPKSPWIAFPALMAELSQSVPSGMMDLIQKFYGRYQEKKLTRQQLINSVRLLVGDRLLISVVKSFRDSNK